jgi:hypothetical protein
LFKRLPLSGAGRRRPAPRGARGQRPELVALESRTVPSTVAWLRPAGGDWDTGPNWAGGRVPTANDDAVIPFAGITVTHATAAADAVRSLNSEAALDLSAGSLTLGSGAADTAARIDALFAVSGGTLALRRTTLDGVGSVVNFGTVRFDRGTANTVNVALDNEAEVSGDVGATGTINNNARRAFVNGPSATLRMVGAGLQLANAFTNQGHIQLGTPISGGGLSVAGGTLVNAPGATIDILTTGFLSAADFDNQGTITTATSGGIGTSGAFVNRGTIAVNAVFLSVSSSAFTNSGTITIAPHLAFGFRGGMFEQDGTVAGTGTLALSGATANFPGGVSTAQTGLSLSGTTLNLPGTLTNVGSLSVAGSTINAPVVNQGTLLAAGVDNTINGPLTNAAGATVSIGDDFSATGSLTAAQGFTNAGTVVQTTSLIGEVGIATLTVAGGTLTNAPGARLEIPVVNAALDNQSTLTITQETTLTGSVANGGTIDVRGGNLTVNAAGSAPAFVNTGSLTVESLRGVLVEGGDFSNRGTVAVGGFGTLLATGSYTQTAGLTRLDGGVLTAGGLVDLEGGVLAGTGVINANVLNNAVLDVGQPGSPGTLTISGDYTQMSGGALVIEIGGPGAGTDFDQLTITGQATLDGTLTVHLINGFVPQSGNSFQVLTFASGSGMFAALTGDGPLFTPSFDPTDVTLVAN